MAYRMEKIHRYSASALRSKYRQLQRKYLNFEVYVDMFTV